MRFDTMRTLLLVAVVACGGAPAFNAPSQTECKVDTDCTIAVVGPDSSKPCCDVTMTAAPMTVAFLTYVEDWRKKNCEPKPSCPPLTLPGHPMECAFKPKCVANKCSNSC